MNPVVVFGGYGTFGRLVVRELTSHGVPVTVAGRDGAHAAEFARSLSPAARGLASDVAEIESCRAALRGHLVAVNCAGPFGRFDSTLLEACLEAGCHYADIADDRAYQRLVREYSERFRARGLSAVYGCSSLPAISGALGLTALEGVTTAPERARITLFIGNDNPKGLAAVRSFVGGIGRPIHAPQGTLRGFRDREVVPLPEPFGRRAAFNLESSEYDLFASLLGVGSVVVKVAFELRSATYACALLAMLGSQWGERTARAFVRLGDHSRWLGTSGGAVMTELFFADASVRRAAVIARRDGQRMAVVPCAAVARALSAGGVDRTGAATAYEFLGAERLLEQLDVAGFERL